MRPILFSANETQFNTNGMGILSDCVSCIVVEERNGMFELEMQYPVDGIHYKSIEQRSIIFAKPSPTRNAQPFRVYRKTSPINGVVSIHAAHISYDLLGVPCSPFVANSAASAVSGVGTNAVVGTPFSFMTDKDNVGEFVVDSPVSVRSLMGGRDGSILDVYGGEWEFDGFQVKLLNERGSNRGVSIRYGKNLTSIEQDENCSDVYTGIYPFAIDGNGLIIQLPEKVVNVEGEYGFTRILSVDLSGEFEDVPTENQLREAARRYIETHNIGVPVVSLSLSFVQLEQAQEYKDQALFERVELCDIVNVQFENLGISATAKCIKTTYNVLLDRFESVDLGDAKTTIADTIVNQSIAVKEASKLVGSALQAAVENATSIITGNKGGYVVIRSSTGAKEPDEILIMDQPSIEEAVNVWRWNKSGLGYSSTGYNGPYGLAMTHDGSIVADFITAGSLDANIIKSGAITSHDGRFVLDLAGNTITVKDANGDVKLGFDASGNLSVKGDIDATSGRFAGELVGARGTFSQISSTGYSPWIKFGSNLIIEENHIKLGTIDIVTDRITLGESVLTPTSINLSVGYTNLVTIDTAGMWIRGYQNSVRFYMNPPTGSGTAAHWVYRSGEGTYSLGIYSSSRRYKDHIRHLDLDASSVIDELKPSIFRYKNDDNDLIGFIAEDVAEVIPELVAFKDGEADSVRYENITALLVADNQRMHERIRQLEERIYNDR